MAVWKTSIILSHYGIILYTSFNTIFLFHADN